MSEQETNHAGEPMLEYEWMAFDICDVSEVPGCVNYWLSKPYQERWAAVEFLREKIFGADRVHARMERVIEVLDLEDLKNEEEDPTHRLTLRVPIPPEK